MRTIPVTPAGGAYEVRVGRGLLGSSEDLPELPGAEKAFLVADANVAGLYGEAAGRALAGLGLSTVPLTVAPGEATKSLDTAQVLYQQLSTQECHRDDVVVALGGGVVGDLAGFVAATYMRGVPFVQLPTSLLAQVDASIGGKVGVNLPRGKNLVGAFHQPRRVIADVDALATLSEREFRSGLAEVAKVGFAVDPSILETIETALGDLVQRDPDLLEDVVARCAAAKASIVSEDERDHGRRAFLNYGHTLGHALEGLDAYRGRSHGEAVAVGMVFAARLSADLGIGDPALVSRHLRALASLGLPHGAEALDPEQVLEVMRMDKKYRQGLRFVLLEDVGRPRLVEDVPEAAVARALEAMHG
jgi:3-dehydroquinate synthase